MTLLKTLGLGVVAATVPAVYASSAAAVTVVNKTLTPTLSGVITGTTTVGPHTKLTYTFTVPAPYRFIFERDAGIDLIDSGFGNSHPFVFTLTTGAQGGTINYTLSTAVPEASTWALMLIGVGGVGLAMRRRKTTVAAESVPSQA